MTEKELRQAILDEAADGRVACKALLELARRTATTPAKIGKLCDKMNVRIRGCQLGCFK